MQLRDVEDFYPLSPLQQGLLFHSLSEPESGMYFNQTLVNLGGDLDVEAFRQAWQGAVDRHPILRTFFVWDGVEEPVQVVRQKAEMPFDVQDWSELSERDRGERLEALRKSDLERGFDLARAPLMRTALIRTAPDSHVLLWSFHHILMDGWSMFHVLGQVFGAYDATRSGATFSAPPSRRYRDHIAWLKQQSLTRAEAYWRRALGGFAAPTPLPQDPTAGSGERGDAGVDALSTSVSAPTTAALQQLCKQHHLTLNTVLQGAWALLLARYSGEQDVLFGGIVSGRPAELEGVESMVGLFINALPIRMRLPDREPLIDWLGRIQAEQAELREYEYTPLVKVREWSEVSGGAPLFETIYLFENYHKDVPLEEMCKSLRIEDVRWFERQNYPIAALAIPGPELMLRIIYETERFSAAAIERMLGHWRTLLEGIAADPNARLEDLPLVTEAEHEQLVVTWNDTATEYPRDACIHELFEEQARRSPDAVALVFEGQQLTYAELNARSNQLAHYLRGLGVGPEIPVGLCLERSLESIVAILGILKAGGAYVALDPDYPKERLEQMLAETRAPVLLTQEHMASTLPQDGTRLVRLDTDWASVAGESQENPNPDVGPENLAYVVYTSGSTGKAKGTCIPHRAVVRLVRNTNFAGMAEDEVFLQFATLSFDASTLELWGSLLNGGRLVIYPAGTPSLEELGDVIQREAVTTLWLTAGLFHQMIEQQAESLRGLRQLLAGGDALSVPHVRMALEKLDDCTLINGYGPTENTTFTCCHPMRRGEASSEIERTVPIGRPISNTTVYVLDKQLRPVPIGVPGDLYTGGDGLARGYLDHPELTAERFVPDPFGARPGGRLYRTGDRARSLAGGVVEFLGRDDNQVKVRGFRIELGEIETVLGAHPAVRNTVVLARADDTAEKRLVAYVVAEPGSSPRTGELRAWLEERLPGYMVPAAFVNLDAFPLTTNGKVDRKALPAPEGTRPELDTAYAAPEADLERAIADIWREFLGLETVGVHDNFFDLGGHSMLLIRVHGKLKASLQPEIRMVDLFTYPTIRALARHLGQGEAGDAPEPVDAAEKRAAGRERLQRLQQRRRGGGRK